MRLATVTLTAVLILACAGVKDSSDDTGASLYEGSACQELMGCYAAASPDASAVTLPARPSRRSG